MLLLAGELPRIINIMHTGAARFLWKPKWPWVKTKPAKPPQPSTTVRAGCNARFLLTRCTFPVRYPVRAPERGPDGKPTPNAETWESRSPLATPGAPGQPCRLFPRQANQRRHRETDRGDGTRTRIRRDGEALGVPTEIIRPVKTWERNQPNSA